MGANQSTHTNRRFFKLIAKAEKANQKDRKVIVEQIKRGTEWTNGEWYSSLSGYITKLETKEIEYQGKKSKLISIELTDSDGVCQVDFGFSGAAYGIINCLVNADFKKELEISGWIKDEKYVNATVKYAGGDKADWAFSIDDQPKPIPFTKPSGEVEKDFTNVKKFWEAELDKLKPKATSANFGGVKKEAVKAAEGAAINPADVSDDLPF